MKTMYIAGPMTGLPDFNYPAFNAAAHELRGHGYNVINPAEFAAPDPDKTWEGYMREAIRQLSRADGIYLLQGWSKSKGARLEARIAVDLGMSIRFQDPLRISESHTRIALQYALSGHQS